MPTMTITYQTEAERVFLERATGYAREMAALAHDTPAADVLAALERHAVDAGRDLVRHSLEAAVADRVAGLEKKTARPTRRRPA